MDYKKAFYSKLQDCYLGAKIKDTRDKSGFSNLLAIKERYFAHVKQILAEKISAATQGDDYEEREIYNKLYTFFDSFLNETGTPFFTDTPVYKNIHARIYSNSKDTALFYKTQNLYYVKSDVIYKSLTLSNENAKFAVAFNADEFRQSSDNTKQKLIFKFAEISSTSTQNAQENADSTREDKREIPLIKINVTNQNELFQSQISVFKQNSTEFHADFLKAIKGLKADEDELKKIFRSYKKQNEVDFFIHKDAAGFLKEQFELWMFSHLYGDSGVHKWQLRAIERLQNIRNIALNLIELIAKFENELKAIWLKPKFAKNTQYVFTLDMIPNYGAEFITDAQITEWKELGLVDENFTLESLKSEFEKFKFLPLDTKFLSDENRLKLLGQFENLDEILSGELIKSDNFAALNTIMPRYKGRIDLIYIDPPFNTGSDFEYKDRFQDSTWLTLMQNRLELAREIFSDRGSFYLHLDHNANFMGRMLLNEIFGKENFRNEIIWYYSNKMANSGNSLAKNTETILNSTKSDNFIFYRQKELRDKPVLLSKREGRDGKNMRARDENGDIIYELSNDRFVDTMWQIPIIGSTSKERVNSDENLTQKPEALLQRIIKASSDENSVILDYHLGSGTSVAAAQKLGRKWLGVEMGEHFYSVIIPRLKKTLGGAQSGISKDVSYKGGGAFRYFELESYEEALGECEYVLSENCTIDYNKSRKLIKSLNKGEKVRLNMSGYRQNFDIFVSYANLIGTKIKRIFSGNGTECAEFENGEIMQKDDVDMAKFPKLRDLIWWGE